MAIGVLGECFTADEFKSKTLLVRVLPSYGQTTLLQLAVEANNIEFVSHQACQNLLNNIWWGKMDELQGEWRVSEQITLRFKFSAKFLAVPMVYLMCSSVTGLYPVNEINKIKWMQKNE